MLLLAWLVVSTTTALVPRSSQLPHVSQRRASRLSMAADGVVVRIKYCTGCRWMLRSAYLAQELLTTFDEGAIRRARSAFPRARTAR